ncbi:GAF domain-containing protein [Micromonospora pisi]|uniref:GAF domain-containing protein n=1 Tax=Micromonospora pisi TaxID=589240 RepID=A0A495JJ74_9ACTN|nr:GAF domain-containing protein [Micromonospora pisi]RKR88434.1 GAF domain-containing protein [Micromonospora pisi]
MRYGFPVFFPASAVVSTFLASLNHGPIRVYWGLGAIAATTGTAIFGVFKERQASAAGDAAARARAQLASGLNRAGAPLLNALGKVTTAKTEQELRAAVDVLTTRVVDIGHSQCGRHNQPRANLRCVYYTYNHDRLERVVYVGRQTNTAPRRHFTNGASAHDNEAIRLTLSEDVLVVDDLHQTPPPHFNDAKGRSYRSFIAVPVRAGETSYGLLTLDSDLPHSLTDVDKGHMVLLAAVLAAGLAHQETAGAVTNIPTP